VSSAPPARLVVVDDAVEFRLLLRVLFRQHDDLMVVAEAADGPAGVIEVERHEPDLVVTDLQMPGGDGLELTRTLRSSRPDLPIVMLTAVPGRAVEDDARAAGVTAFLDKVAATTLPDLVRRTLRCTGRLTVSDGAGGS
jgi:two-component system, NarL family, response regulator DesR